ncbi:MAG TPA: CGNR zinc finger domain-containing protein [Candidatus Dormibacteraeota bacterium]
MGRFQPADASTFEALMTIASGLHGPDASNPTELTLHLAGGKLDRMRDPKDAAMFLNNVASWWRAHSDSISWTMPTGPIPISTLGRMRQMRDAVQALADRDRAGYQRRLKALADHYTYRLDAQTGALRSTGRGWDAFVAGLLPALVELDEHSDRLRHCANEDCAWVILDTTRNGTRTWCHSTLCGNKMRVRRFRARQRKATSHRIAGKFRA